MVNEQRLCFVMALAHEGIVTTETLLLSDRDVGSLAYQTQTKNKITNGIHSSFNAIL